MQKPFVLKVTALCSVLAFQAACGGDEGTAGPAEPSTTVLKSNLERDTNPTVTPADSSALSAGNRAFACDLYAELAAKPGNLFFSPYSISAALAMTYAGARNETETEMAEALHFALAQSQLHPAFNRLDLELASRAEAQPPSSLPDAKPPRLNIANSLWGQQDYAFETPFLDTLAVNYGAGLRLLDFGADSEGCRTTINQWVSGQTEARIPELIPSGAITGDTRLVLVNAIYFLAYWLNPFKPEATSPGTFVTADEAEATVDMMLQVDYFDYAAADGYAAAALPYAGGDLSMLVLLPDPGRFAEVEAKLGPELLDTIDAGLENRNVRLTMPKWKLEASFLLADTLAALGMPSAFAPERADFGGMTSAEQLFISDVIHQAYISVDENGTEAAAATAVMMAGSSLPLEPVALTLDHPFIFMIRDEPTGAVLFVGRVSDPSL